MRALESRKIHDHGVISEIGNNTALPSVFFVLIAYTMQRNALIAVLQFLAAYMHIGNRYVDIYVLNAA